ncbi:MAG: recombinase family protein [Ruminiclostridium sp.]|uniref:recombinase family protein n=1 Tax=Ruminococcus sp. TaxID=41978 RepID=UPI0025E6EA28|nr:recombinase family protein [Ruminococcus sp.]MBR1432255.1 recombinase family protein [Ruminococcus sp.]MBR1831083.1 recombinase family protein [Ruminiclostridium sp.]
MKCNRNIPFGYMMRGGKYLTEPAESEAVRQIFDMYLNGMSLKSIAAEMTVPYNTNKPLWNRNMVSRILENKRYLGDDTYPQIIDRDTFDRANAIKSEKGKSALPVDNTTKYLRSLIEYGRNTECKRLNVNDIRRLAVTAINMLIAEPTLAAPTDSLEYKPSARLTLAEEQIKEQMSDSAADADRLMTDILRAVSMRYDSIKYDDRDKTAPLLDLLMKQDKTEDFDMELTQNVIKHIVIDSGTVSAVLVNGKVIKLTERNIS